MGGTMPMQHKRQMAEELSAHRNHAGLAHTIACTRMLILVFFAAGLFNFLSCSQTPSIVPRQGRLDGGKVSVFQYARPETVGISSASLQRIGDEIEQWVRNGDIVGAEWLVIKDRKIVMHEAVGWKDLEDNIPMTINTIFRIQSMTKPVVGTCILMLAQEGKLELSNPVSKFLPAFDNEKSREITLRHLLTHTGGFAEGRDFSFKKYNSLNEAVEEIGTMGPQSPPGARYQYSNLGYAVLGALVAEVSGIPVEDFIQARILTPLGMADTLCNLTMDDPRRKRVSSTYANTIFGPWKYWDNTEPQVMTYFRACGGMYSTPDGHPKYPTCGHFKMPHPSRVIFQ